MKFSYHLTKRPVFICIEYTSPALQARAQAEDQFEALTHLNKCRTECMHANQNMAMPHPAIEFACRFMEQADNNGFRRVG